MVPRYVPSHDTAGTGAGAPIGGILGSEAQLARARATTTVTLILETFMITAHPAEN